MLVLSTFVLTLLARAASTSDLPPAQNTTHRTALEWYTRGVSAYLDNAWFDCVDYMNKALDEWRYVRGAVIDCRLRCKDEASAAPHLFPEDIEHLHFGEEMVRRTLCLIKCGREAFKGRRLDGVNSKEEEVFEDLKVYEYLQLCYFQRNKYQEAASAVFTYLVRHPDNDMMKNNLKYYLSLPEVDINNVVNYEAEKFVPAFIMGTEAYRQADYPSTVSHIEESLKEYLKAEEGCRAECEGSFDQGWLPDFTSSISNHFVYCLKCKQRCHLKLYNLNGDQHDDLLAEHYHYLQYAYYKMEKLKEACEAVASYLLFFPTDKTMLQNKEFYRKMPEVEENMFKPRTEAVLYLKRHKYEASLLSFITDEFIFHGKPDGPKMSEEPLVRSDSREENNMKPKAAFLDSRSSSTNDPLPPSVVNLPWSQIIHDNLTAQLTDDVAEGKRRFKRPIKERRTTANANIGTKWMKTESNEQEKKYKILENPGEEQMNGKEEKTDKYNNNKKLDNLQIQLPTAIHRDIHNLCKEDELNGQQRFSVDGLADQDECQRIIQLAQMAGVNGDGYKGNVSPLSNLEKFEGVTLGRAALMVHYGLMKQETLDVFIRLSERGRNMTAWYFNIKGELYFSYTHLVCRTALPGRPTNATILSHQIHADNCLLQNNGECPRVYPAYTWRDYSAILYLNEDFEGGEFIFSADPAGKVVQSKIKPTCGRMVGFSAGEENLHGVRGVKRGQRCAIGLWFTLDHKHAEWGRILAEQMIHEMKTLGTASDWLVKDLQDLVKFDLNSARERVKETEASEQCAVHRNDCLKQNILDETLQSTKVIST